MTTPSLTASFSGLQGRGYACALLIRPGNPNVEGERLEALSRAAIGSFRRVVLFLDDVTCGDTPEQSELMARDWLERNRERLNDCGIDLETMSRWSEYPVMSFFEGELRKLAGNDQKARQVLHSFALKASNQETPDFQTIHGALAKTFQRMAAYILMKGVCQMPVVGTDDIPSDSRIFDKGESAGITPGLLLLPDTYNIHFSEQKPVVRQPDPAPAEPQTAKIIPFTPRQR